MRSSRAASDENPYVSPAEGPAPPTAPEVASGPLIDVESLPPLMRDRSFWGMTVTQFLGAFNDNLYKQLMLLLAIPVGAAAVVERDQQGLATALFALPFILFSGYAGYLSDRNNKRTVIVLSKTAEIVVMLLGMAAFAAFGALGNAGLLLVLFLMGAQSTFFGPGKYGILPETLRETDLPRANGIILMTTFLAIIFGTAAAGGLGELFIDDDAPAGQGAARLWMGSAFCVAIAVAGTGTSLLIRSAGAARPQLPFEWSTLAIPQEMRSLLRRDRALLAALLASCMFWLVSGVAIQAVNSLGMVQLGEDKLWTSVLVSVIGLGIAIGAVLAGRLSRGRVDFRIVRTGLWGIVLFLSLLSISLPGGRHLLGYWGSAAALVMLGASAGFFAIPLQVFMQSRPPQGLKGRLIAVMNQANFVAILLSGGFYALFDRIVVWLGWPRSPIFAMMAVLTLPILLLYRPRNEES